LSGTTEDELAKVHAKVNEAHHNNSFVVRASIVRKKSQVMVVLLDLDDATRKKANVTFTVHLEVFDGMLKESVLFVLPLFCFVFCFFFFF
jgi:hypothetical protein